MAYISAPSANPAIPEGTEKRDDLTLAQKKRIAMWATMGIGPEGEKLEPTRSPPRYKPQGQPPQKRATPGIKDPKVLMLEAEKRLKDQQETEDNAFLQKTDKRAKPRIGGMISLGTVQPREDVKVPFISPIVRIVRPQAASDDEDDEEEKRPEARCSCGEAYLPDAKFCAECGAKRVVSATDMVKGMLRKEKHKRLNEEEERKANEKKEALLREQRIKQWQQERQARMEQNPKKKKKRKKTRDSEDEEDEESRESLPAEEVEESAIAKQERKEASRWAREGGAYRQMDVPSVKGMVSNDYKGFTDADLERRFPQQQNSSAGSLMSEKEAMAMIRKEKSDKGNISGAKRVQRELAEWQALKADRRARRSKSREHLVVGRK